MQHVLAAQQGRFALWLPVFMGAGTLLYFSLRFEPPLWAAAAIGTPTALGIRRRAGMGADAAGARRRGDVGFGAAQLATARAPPLEVLPRQAVQVSGVVSGVEMLPEGRRITLRPGSAGPRRGAAPGYPGAAAQPGPRPRSRRATASASVPWCRRRRRLPIPAPGTCSGTPSTAAWRRTGSPSGRRS